MFEVLRSFWAPKTSGYENEYEDFADWNPSSGVAAIADGVSTAIFSRAWARILTTAVVTEPPAELTENGSLTTWLTPYRQSWSELVDIPKLKWNQVQKLEECGGGWATLLWLHLEECATVKMRTERGSDQDSADDPLPDDSDVEFTSAEDALESTSWSMTCHAIGDCNLFVVRDGQLQLSHPMQSSAAYAKKPHAVCSMNRGRDSQINILTTTFDCHTGDTLFLCTDAIGQWLWSELEQHNREFDWQGLNNCSDEEWHAEVQRLRGASRMPIDDCTLVILRVGATIQVPPVSSDADPLSENHFESEIETVAIVDGSDIAVATGLVAESLVSTLIDVNEDAAELPLAEIESIAESEVGSAVAVPDSETAEPLPEA